MLNIFLWIISPVIVYITLVLLKDLIAYITYLLYYKSQGIKFQYLPFLGLLGFVLPRKGQKDVGRFMADLINIKRKDEKIIAFNNFDSTQMGLLLRDPELIGKFFLQETEYTRRQHITQPIFKEGLFWTNGPKALAIRAAFNDFFQPSKLKDYVPVIRKIIDKNMEKLKEKYNNREDKSDEFMRINLTEFFPMVFSEIVNELMFGNDFPTHNGQTIPELVSDAIEFAYMKVMRNPINFLTFGLAGKLKLLQAARDLKEMISTVEKIVHDVIKSRKKVKKRELNMIDLMLDYNETVEDKTKIMDDFIMIGNITLLQSAGVDTSKNTTLGLIDYLSIDVKKQRKLVEDILPNLYKNEEDKYKYETYENNKYLSSMVFESLRSFGPAHIAFPKLLLKDMQLGEYKLKKGSFILIPIYAIHKNEDNFEDAYKFDESRFSEDDGKKVKRNTFMPFSLGRRACPGKYLAELMIKINIASFFENFELREIKGKDREMIIRFTYCVKDCIVDLKPRS